MLQGLNESLGLSWQIIIAYLINIVILFLFLRFLLYKPIRKYLDHRELAYKQKQDDIAMQEEQANEIKAKYDGFMSKANEESTKIISESRLHANERSNEIVQEAREQAGQMMEHTRREIAEERKNARVAMGEEVADLAVSIATRILEREVSAQDNKHIVDKFLTKERLG